MLRQIRLILLVAAIKVSVVKSVTEIDVRLNETQVPEAGVLLYTLPNGNGSTYHKVQDHVNVNAHMVNVTPDGRILSTESLDFESNSWTEDYSRDRKMVVFPVSLLAEGQVKGPWSVLVRITVKDVNDESPVFLNYPLPMISAMKPNLPPSSLVYYLGAKDQDRTAEIRFSITKEQPEGIFELGEDGDIRIKTEGPLPEGTEYILYVEAEDVASETEERQTTGEVKLSIMSGYVPPMFSLPYMNVTVQENNVPDFRAVTFGAASFIGSPFTFSILDETVPFRLEPDERDRHSRVANLIVKKSLDRESGISAYQFTVKAQEDNHEAQMNGEYGNNIPDFGYCEVQVNVQVKDVNDNAPKLTHHYEPVVYENEGPKVIAELECEDEDDSQAGNGPPFTFSVSPLAEDSVKKAFTVTTNTSGPGRGILSSLKMFDREAQSSYSVPVVITDAGSPPQSTTSIIPVLIGDVDDNPMLSGHKHITVYNFLRILPDVNIGRVFVNDPDDWDTKLYSWADQPSRYFHLNETTGQISYKSGTPPGEYPLEFEVRDNVGMTGNVTASVNVTVKEVTGEAMDNAVILTLPNVTASEFLRQDYITSEPMHTNVNSLKKIIQEFWSERNQKTEIHVYSIQEEVRSSTTLLQMAVGAEIVQKQSRIMRKKELEKSLQRSTQISSVAFIGEDLCKRDQRCYSCKSFPPYPSPIGDLFDCNQTSFFGINIHIQTDCSDEKLITDKEITETVQDLALEYAKKEENIRNVELLEISITASFDYLRVSTLMIEYGVRRYKCNMILKQFTFELDHIIGCEPACMMCDCENFGCPDTEDGQCSGPDHGFCECGTCWCNPGYEGRSCLFKSTTAPCQNNSEEVCSGRGQCYLGECRCEESAGGRYCEKNQTELVGQCRPTVDQPVCSEHGNCEEGHCACYLIDGTQQTNSSQLLRYTGRFCECDDSSCPKNFEGEVCSGPSHGTCGCGVCKCLPGWEGENCECSPDINSCKQSDDGQVCSGRGTCVCGGCRCDRTSYGTYCEAEYCRPYPTAPICSGRGTCVGGSCECDALDYEGNFYSGSYCQCDPFSCDRYNGRLCNGSDRGFCDCGVCQCYPGFEGKACQCPTSTDVCKNDGDDRICSGRGSCVCGKCLCVESHGQYCEDTPWG